MKKKTRVLLVYETLSTDELGPLKRELYDKFYDEDLVVYNTDSSVMEQFMKDAGHMDYIFYEKTEKIEKTVHSHVNGSTRLIGGVRVDDEVVKKFIFSL